MEAGALEGYRFRATNVLRLLIREPALPESQAIIRLDRHRVPVTGLLLNHEIDMLLSGVVKYSTSL